MANERYPLRQVILDDLTSHNKVAIILLIGVIASAVATIWITHQTRLLIAEQGRLTRIAQQFDNKYVHLQLDENSLSNKTRIEGVSGKFGLQPVQKEQEEILVEQ